MSTLLDLRPSPNGDKSDLLSGLRDLFERTLVLSPHIDDDIFVYGLLGRVRQSGGTVHIAVATTGEHFQPHARRIVTAGERLQELTRAAQHIQVASVRIGFPGQDARLGARPVGDVIRWIEACIEGTQPTAVLFPVPSHHQDHRVVHEAALAVLRPGAARSVGLAAAYEYPFSAVWPLPHAGPMPGRMVIDVSGPFFETKMRALLEHRSQFEERAPHSPLHPDAVRTLAAFRGLEIGVEYAEVLYPLRIVL